MNHTPTLLGIEHDRRGTRLVWSHAHPSRGEWVRREHITQRPNWPAVAIGVGLVWLGAALALTADRLDGMALIGGPGVIALGGWVLVRQMRRAGVS